MLKKVRGRLSEIYLDHRFKILLRSIIAPVSSIASPRNIKRNPKSFQNKCPFRDQFISNLAGHWIVESYDHLWNDEKTDLAIQKGHRSDIHMNIHKNLNKHIFSQHKWVALKSDGRCISWDANQTSTWLQFALDVRVSSCPLGAHTCNWRLQCCVIQMNIYA